MKVKTLIRHLETFDPELNVKYGVGSTEGFFEKRLTKSMVSPPCLGSEVLFFFINIDLKVTLK